MLRHLEESDAAALLGVFGDPQVMRFGDGVQTPAAVRSWIAWVLQWYAEKGFGPLAVVERKTGSLIGYCGLFEFPDINGRPEIELGYRLVRAVWGQGFATEAAMAVRDFAFGTLGIERLVSLIDPENTASVAVAKKLGMVYAADVMLDGYTHPDHVYLIEKTG